MVTGRITINCYEMDFTVGVLHYAASGIAFGFTFLTYAVINVVHAILYPFSLIPPLPYLIREERKFLAARTADVP